MKSYFKIYLKFALFILINFIFISIILAGIISFIHIPNFIYHLIINLIAGLLMIVWGFLIVKTFKKNAIYHSLLCGLIFALVALMVNIDDINILNIISRPFVLITTVIILNYYQRKIDNYLKKLLKK